MYLPAARVSAPRSKNFSTDSRQPGTYSSILLTKFSRPQGRVASMGLPSLAVVITRKLSGTMYQLMSSPNSSTMVWRQPPGFSALPNSHSSCSAVSNSKRPLLKLEATPPGRLCCSTSSVFLPALASLHAAASPPLPAPITTASNLGISYSSCRQKSVMWHYHSILCLNFSFIVSIMSSKAGFSGTISAKYAS